MKEILLAIIIILLLYRMVSIEKVEYQIQQLKCQDDGQICI